MNQKNSDANNNEALEAHHRAKNSLQNIISYLNIVLGTKDSLSRAEVKKITTFVHSLSSLHNAIFEQMKFGDSGANVQIDRVIKDLTEMHEKKGAVEFRCDQPVVVTSRRGATLSLVVNELLSNSETHGLGDTLVILRKEAAQNEPDAVAGSANSLATLTVSNRVESSVSDVTLQSGLKLATALIKSDLGSGLQVSARAGQFSTSFVFPCE